MGLVRLGIRRVQCDVNINRDMDTVKGVWLGRNPAGPSDKTVTVLRFDGENGTPTAALFHYGVQSSVMDHCELSGGGQLVTSDLAVRAAAGAEDAFGGDCVAFFLPGPSGDQAPREKGKFFQIDKKGSLTEQNFHERGFAFSDQLGAEPGTAPTFLNLIYTLSFSFFYCFLFADTVK